MDALSCFKSWILDLAPEERFDVVVMAGVGLGVFPSIVEVPELDEAESALFSYMDFNDPMREIGLILSLYSVIDYSIISNRRCSNQWEKTEQIFRELADKNQDPRYLRKAESVKFLAMRWKRSIERWDSEIVPLISKENLDRLLII